MYYRMLDAYLTHYCPALKAELEETGRLQCYLDDQVEAMRTTRNQILTQLVQQEPQMSQLQRELEADQMVQQLFLTPL